MGKVVVVTDSSAYIPEAALNGLEIPVMPLWLIWDGVAMRDGVDITPTAFYQRLRESATFPSSSQPTPRELAEFLRAAAENAGADTVLALMVSSKISATHTNTVQACELLPDLDVRVVDSLNVAMGLGFVVLAAARTIAAGGSPDDAIAAAQAMIPRIEFFFAVDTLEYLYRGGRIGNARRLLGTALQIKPLLEWRDGMIEPLCQVRTKRKALDRLFELAEERLAGRRMAEAAVLDVDVPAEGDELLERVRARFDPIALYRSTVSPVVGTHAGPGTLGLIFYAAD